MRNLKKNDREINIALQDAIWILRWNEDETALSAVLTVKEANQIVENILKGLDSSGYKIVKK